MNTMKNSVKQKLLFWNDLQNNHLKIHLYNFLIIVQGLYLYTY